MVLVNEPQFQFPLCKMQAIMDSTVWLRRLEACREVNPVPTVKWALCKCQSDDDDACYYSCCPFTDTFLTSVSFSQNTSYPPSLVFSQICLFHKVFFQSFQPDIFFLSSELSGVPLSFGTKPLSCSLPVSRATTQIPKQLATEGKDHCFTCVYFVFPAWSPVVTSKIHPIVPLMDNLSVIN